MIYITGDCHGRFGRFMSGGFSCCPDLTENDTVIVCGDLGLLWAKESPLNRTVNSSQSSHLHFYGFREIMRITI